jgi:hypothetical protein
VRRGEGTYFTQGGRVFGSVGIKIKGGRERKEGKGGGRGGEKEHLPFISTVYGSLFCEQFVVHNLKNLFMALNMTHTLLAYTVVYIYLSCLKIMICNQFETQNLKYVGAVVVFKHQTECMGTTQYDQVDIQYISNHVHTHQHMIHDVIDMVSSHR